MDRLALCPLCMNDAFCRASGNPCMNTRPSLCHAFQQAYNMGCAAPENKPLTLDELRGMDGNKIYIHYIGHCFGFYEDEVAPYYGDKEQYIQRYNGMLHACDLPLKYYGIEWLAYARKPEGIETDG